MRSHGMALLIQMFDFEEGCEDDVRAWLDEAHLRRHTEVPGVVGAAAYEAAQGTPRFLNLYEGESVHAFYTEGFRSVAASAGLRGTPLEKKVTGEVRLTCAQIYPGLPGRSPACPTVDVAGLAPLVQLGRIFVPSEKAADFHGWYAQDRAPLCERVPGVRRLRRYAVVEGEPVMVVLYEMEGEAVRETKEWKEMNGSEWTARVRGYYRQAPGSPGVYLRRGDAR